MLPLTKHIECTSSIAYRFSDALLPQAASYSVGRRSEYGGWEAWDILLEREREREH